jgi:hypothetical protein
MSNPETDQAEPNPDEGSRLDHDARPEGPAFNTPDNEPDPHNPDVEDVDDKNR